jgi:hypothetical protein
MLRKPKSVAAAEASISEELKSEKLKVMREFLWNKEISDAEANAAIDAYNAKHMAAGGTKGGCIVNRG